jgi:HlyD family secretion protein
MDVPRPEHEIKRRKNRRIAIAAIVVLVLAAATVGLARLEPAAPSVERATVWLDTVKRGEMLRQVRGTGTLVPVEIRWITAATDARVERIVELPGTIVTPDTVILELSNSELSLATLEAESQARAARAQLKELEVRLQSQRLDQQATVARVESEQKQAELQSDAKTRLAAEGLVADIDLKLAQTTAAETARRLKIEEERLSIAGESMEAQLAVQRAELEQKEAVAHLKRAQVAALTVRAGISGILQQVPVEVGQRVSPGSNLARVAQPEHLKAVVKIPETLARDVQIGQTASVDTRNGIVQGKVSRVDPAVQEGTVTVDISLDGEKLPKGARPDLTVDGTIELERIKDTLHVGRPAMAQPETTVGLFRLEPDGRHARRVQVHLGRASVSTIEVLSGLKEGDQVILSDTSPWDAFDRILLD